jgi:hypothetical protein
LIAPVKVGVLDHGLCGRRARLRHVFVHTGPWPATKWC